MLHLRGITTNILLEKEYSILLVIKLLIVKNNMKLTVSEYCKKYSIRKESKTKSYYRADHYFLGIANSL